MYTGRRPRRTNRSRRREKDVLPAARWCCVAPRAPSLGHLTTRSSGQRFQSRASGAYRMSAGLRRRLMECLVFFRVEGVSSSAGFAASTRLKHVSSTRVPTKRRGSAAGVASKVRCAKITRLCCCAPLCCLARFSVWGLQGLVGV